MHIPAGFLYKLFIDRIRDRLLERNKNWLCVVCGDTGSGKSYSAISLACEVSTKERVFVVFTPLEFLDLLNSGKLRKGDTIVADEFGVAMSSRDWYSIHNKLLSNVLQTFRHLNIAVIFTVPNLSFVDSNARKLYHCLLETCRIDYENQRSILKPFDILTSNRYSDGVTYAYPKFKIDNQEFKLTSIGFDIPDEDLIEDYEARKKEYTAKLNKAAYDELKELEDKVDKKKDKELSNEEIIKAIQKETERFKTFNSKYHKEVFDDQLIRLEFSLPRRRAELIKRLLITPPRQTSNS